MNLDRRTVLGLAGLGVGTALAGCLDFGGGSEGTDAPEGTAADPDATVAAHETIPLSVEGSAPLWYVRAEANDGDDDSDQVGYAAVADSRGRARNALGRFDLSEERREAVDAFLDDVEYESDRLVLLESVGPNGCHDELAVENVRLEEGQLRADAAVVDTSEAGAACSDALVYPSTLLGVTFEGDPVDEVAVDVTDGWDETATVTVSVEDPLLTPHPGNLPGHVRPESDADPLVPLRCDDGDVRRHDQWYDEETVQWGDYEDAGDVVLSLRVEDLEYAYGDTARITLTNVTGETVHTGNREKYNLQAYTTDGWQDVRIKDDQGYFEYTDEAVGHASGGGFEWTVDLTEAGVVEDSYHDDVRVCPELQPGRYRFAYFGVVDEGAVAVSFDLTE